MGYKWICYVVHNCAFLCLKRCRLEASSVNIVCQFTTNLPRNSLLLKLTQPKNWIFASVECIGVATNIWINTFFLIKMVDIFLNIGCKYYTIHIADPWTRCGFTVPLWTGTSNIAVHFSVMKEQFKNQSPAPQYKPLMAQVCSNLLYLET